MSDRKLFGIIGIVAGILCFGGAIIHDVVIDKKQPIIDTLYITKIDTTKVNHLETEIALLEYELKLTRDSLAVAKDNLGEDLFVARYKLERIRYYTNIVDKNPNQIKFYKGWIKRVINN